MKNLFIAASVLLVACGGPNAEEVEERQNISKANAEYNIRQHLAETGIGFNKISVQSDSTVGKDGCKFGDGWATAKVNLPTGQNMTYKCQTNGSGKGIKGCLSQVDFNAKPVYEEQDGVCDTSIKSLKLLDK